MTNETAIYLAIHELADSAALAKNTFMKYLPKEGDSEEDLARKQKSWDIDYEHMLGNIKG